MAQELKLIPCHILGGADAFAGLQGGHSVNHEHGKALLERRANLFEGHQWSGHTVSLLYRLRRTVIVRKG